MTGQEIASDLEHTAHLLSSSGQGSWSFVRPSKIKGLTNGSVEWSAGFVAKAWDLAYSYWSFQLNL